MRKALIANLSQPFKQFQNYLLYEALLSFTFLNKRLQFTFRFEIDIQTENPRKKLKQTLIYDELESLEIVNCFFFFFFFS
jgi:hypothetical protein